MLFSLTACNLSLAATPSYRGNFTQDDDVRLISFSLASASDVEIRTYSYGGGIQADGTPIDPGGYTVALAQYDNFASGQTLAAGFDRVGDGTFTSSFHCSNGSFCDFGGHNRSNAWAVDILVTEVPEPSVYALLSIGFGALLSRRSR